MWKQAHEHARTLLQTWSVASGPRQRSALEQVRGRRDAAEWKSARHDVEGYIIVAASRCLQGFSALAAAPRAPTLPSQQSLQCADTSRSDLPISFLSENCHRVDPSAAMLVRRLGEPDLSVDMSRLERCVPSRPCGGVAFSHVYTATGTASARASIALANGCPLCEPTRTARIALVHFSPPPTQHRSRITLHTPSNRGGRAAPPVRSSASTGSPAASDLPAGLGPVTAASRRYAATTCFTARAACTVEREPICPSMRCT